MGLKGLLLKPFAQTDANLAVWVQARKTNILVNFNGMSMHKLHVCYKFQATLSATVFHCITTEQTLSPHFFVEGLCFFCKSFTNPRCSFLLRYNVDCNTYILGLIIKLKIYRTTLLYTSHTTDANTLGNGCIIA